MEQLHTLIGGSELIVAPVALNPLMIFAPEDGFAEFALRPADLAGFGFCLAASSGTAFAALYKAVRQSYAHLAAGTIDPFLGSGGAAKEKSRSRKSAQDAKWSFCLTTGTL